MSANKEHWGTRVGLILAMAGNAVGLGNFLRFPMKAIENGGGAFMIPYIVCFLLMGIPLLWMEWSMGRFGGRFGNHSTPFILDNMTKRKFWKYFGVFGIFTNIGVASYYCYIESWTLSYVIHSAKQTFATMNQAEVGAFFDGYTTLGHSYLGIPFEALFFYIICLLLNTYILSRGLSEGVEKVATYGMPLLITFGVLLALRGFTMGSSEAPPGCSDCNAFIGINYLWEPKIYSLTNPKVWLEAAGQIFFTLSVGMGTIHCYAAYVKPKEDIALNAMSAGWMNGFVEVVLGASVVIPISVGYLGLERVLEISGFDLAFKSLPYLFSQWGVLLGTLGGVLWFGLLFFAGITSSLAMGTPWMGFMEDEFDWGRKKAAWSFGGLVLLMGLPTVLFFHQGVFGEYDFWAGTVSLVVFAFAETILYNFVFGTDRGWNEVMEGADIQVPDFYRYILRYVTPILLGAVFVASLITPKGNDWANAFSNGWELDGSSIIGKILNVSVKANRQYFADHYESESKGVVSEIRVEDNLEGQPVKTLFVSAPQPFYRNAEGEAVPLVEETAPEGASVFDSTVAVWSYTLRPEESLLVEEGDPVDVKTPVVQGDRINRIFYTDMARLLLMLLFFFICFVVYQATQRRARMGRTD